MAPDGQEIETIVALGLNRTQARVYLTLLKVGKAKAKTIWECSKVARQDIYRILTELEKKSIVEKIIDSPAEFRAVPLQTCVSILLEKKQNEFCVATEKSKELIRRFTKKQKTEATAKGYENRIISTNEAYIRKLKEGVITSNETIDVIDTFDGLSYHATVYPELILALYDKNVKFRYITNRPGKGRRLPELLKNAELVEVRFISKEPLATLIIEDKKRATLSLTRSIHKSEEAPKLISDSPCFVAILHDYFERIWNEAIKDVDIWNSIPLRSL
jgi:sugar-specific transcriptional regulator TrmB